MEGPAAELGREEKSLNGLWAAEKWRNTGGDGVGFRQLSREGEGRGMEERRSEEEAMAGEVERNEIRVVEEESEEIRVEGVYGTLEFHLYGERV